MTFSHKLIGALFSHVSLKNPDHFTSSKAILGWLQVGHFQCSGKSSKQVFGGISRILSPRTGLYVYPQTVHLWSFINFPPYSIIMIRILYNKLGLIIFYTLASLFTHFLHYLLE